jgi:amidase
MRDSVHPFVDYPDRPVASAEEGVLLGRTLAVKDVYDVAGYPTGGGHPLLRRTAGRRSTHASAVAALLGAGARFVGKTHTDEFAYSMNGENQHYGMPANPRAPGRIPGGSSSGSASAVASGLADLALGTDTGGSVRLPASYCGLIGLRTTHGSISLAGVQPLAPSFDTVGWFARDLDLYLAVAEVLIGEPGASTAVRQLVVADDILEQVIGPLERMAFSRCLERASERVPIAGHVRVAEGQFDRWRHVFRVIQAFEAWSAHGEWIERHKPELGEGIRQRFEWARGVTRDDYLSAQESRRSISAHIRSLVPAGTALIFPTAPSVAPLPGRQGDELENYRARAISMMCSAGLAGLPQLSLPMGAVEGLPFGLSLLGWPDSDFDLLRLAKELPTDTSE